MYEGIGRIAIERARQIYQEGYDAHHDDDHYDASLGRAAIHYAARAMGFHADLNVEAGQVVPAWPDWHVSHDKTSENGPIRNLEIAGALIAAEIDRRLRIKG